MLYFEDARLEFLGVPMAYFPYMSAPDPTVKRKTGVLTPSYSTSSVYGLGVTVPYYWALAPDYDFTFTPMITSRQGPLLQGEWRQRLLNGAYSIRATGLFQARQGAVCKYAWLSRLARQHRNGGPVQSFGQVGLGMERDAAVGQELSLRLRHAQEHSDKQSAHVHHARLHLVPALPRGPRRSQLLRRAHDVLLWPLASRRSGPASGRASGDRPRLCLQEPDIRR